MQNEHLRSLEDPSVDISRPFTMFDTNGSPHVITIGSDDKVLEHHKIFEWLTRRFGDKRRSWVEYETAKGFRCRLEENIHLVMHRLSEYQYPVVPGTDEEAGKVIEEFSTLRVFSLDGKPKTFRLPRWVSMALIECRQSQRFVSLRERIRDCSHKMLASIFENPRDVFPKKHVFTSDESDALARLYGANYRGASRSHPSFGAFLCSLGRLHRQKHQFAGTKDRKVIEFFLPPLSQKSETLSTTLESLGLSKTTQAQREDVLSRHFAGILSGLQGEQDPPFIPAQLFLSHLYCLATHKQAIISGRRAARTAAADSATNEQGSSADQAAASAQRTDQGTADDSAAPAVDAEPRPETDQAFLESWAADLDGPDALENWKERTPASRPGALKPQKPADPAQPRMDPHARAKMRERILAPALQSLLRQHRRVGRAPLSHPEWVLVQQALSGNRPASPILFCDVESAPGRDEEGRYIRLLYEICVQQWCGTRGTAIREGGPAITRKTPDRTRIDVCGRLGLEVSTSIAIRTSALLTTIDHDKSFGELVKMQLFNNRTKPTWKLNRMYGWPSDGRTRGTKPEDMKQILLDLKVGSAPFIAYHVHSTFDEKVINQLPGCETLIAGSLTPFKLLSELGWTEPISLSCLFWALFSEEERGSINTLLHRAEADTDILVLITFELLSYFK